MFWKNHAKLICLKDERFILITGQIIIIIIIAGDSSNRFGF